MAGRTRRAIASPCAPSTSTGTSCPVVNLTRACAFCHRTTDDPVQYGAFQTCEGVVAHYFCVLLSTMLMQNGQDHQGIHGFLVRDILKMLKKTINAKCVYCKLPNATVLCKSPNCKIQFHYPCGLENGATACFMNDFPSFCSAHNETTRRMRMRSRSRSGSGNRDMCIYCYDRIDQRDSYYTTACCKTCCMHVTCLRRHALAFGYFTRCPNCNNLTNFIESIKQHGVYIPEADPLWDVDNEVIQEYAAAPRACEVKPCRCRHGIGSGHDAVSGFCKLINCRVCGGNPAHVKCKRTTGQTYLCQICRPIEMRRKPVKHPRKKSTRELRVVLLRLDLNRLRAAGIEIPCKYNLRGRKSTFGRLNN